MLIKNDLTRIVVEPQPFHRGKGEIDYKTRTAICKRSEEAGADDFVKLYPVMREKMEAYGC